MSKDVPPPYSSAPPGFVTPGQFGPGEYPPPPVGGHYPPLPPQGQYPSGHHGFPPNTEQQQHTVIVSTTTAPLMVGPEPTRATCPHCHASIVTAIEVEPNTKTHLFALLCCLFGCWPCCCIPYCMDSCQSKKHHCPNCRAYLGTYSE